jgi:hypothetical protein
VNVTRCQPPLDDEEVGRIARSVGRYAPAASDAKREDTKVTDRDAAVQLATDAELWHSTDGTEFATIEVRGHRDHVPVGGRHFKAWLTLRFREKYGRTASPDTIAAACSTAGSIALLNGPEHEVSVRVGSHGGRIYLDLCDEARRAVEIGRDGWRIVTNPPVRFQRPGNALALPEPAPGGSLDALRGFVNAPGTANGHS